MAELSEGDLEKAWKEFTGSPRSALLFRPSPEDRDGERAESLRCQRELEKSLSCPGESRISVSHSAGRILAVAACMEKAEARVGADIERTARRLSARATARVVLPEERVLGLEPIELWSIKEAVFKANPRNSGTTVSQSKVLSFDSRSRSGTAQAPGLELSCRFRLVGDSTWVIAFAVASS